MFKEFLATYIKRAIVILPFYALITLLPPYPIEVKIATMIAFFVILLIPQLVEVLLVLKNARRVEQDDIARAAEETVETQSRVGDPSLPQSRKERRAIARRRDGGYL